MKTVSFPVSSSMLRPHRSTRPFVVHLSGVAVLLRPSLVAYLSVGVLVPMSRQGLVAQAQPQTVAARGDTTLAASLATITADTGAFAPGHRDFTAYTTPAMCLAAAMQAHAHALVSVAAQTRVISDPDRNQNDVEDTLGLGAAGVVARACGARFTARFTQPPTLPRDLQTLFELTIYEQNAPLARQMLATLLTQQHSQSDSEAIYRYGIERYAGVGWLTAATALIQQVDVPGAGASQRYLAMLLWGTYVDDRWGRDLAHHSRYGPAIDRMIQLYDSLPPNLSAKSNETAWFVIDWAWHYRARLELESGLPVDSIAPIAHIQQREIDGMDDTLNQKMLLQGHAEVRKHRTIDDLMFGFEPLVQAWASYQLKVGGGGIAPRLTATSWYPPPGHSTTDTVRPAPHKVNVMCQSGDLSSLLDGGGARTAYVEMHEMRNWLAMYGAQNLEITLVHPARGFDALDYYMEYAGFIYWPTPKVEAEAWRWYVQDVHQLPVTVAVQTVEDQWNPAPDGRRASERQIQFAEYFPPKSFANMQGAVKCVVIDREGHTVYASLNQDARDFQQTNLALQAVFRREPSR